MLTSLRSSLPIVLASMIFWGSMLLASNSSAKALSYKIDGQDFEGFYLASTQSKAPGILLIHNWKGVTEETQKQAKRFHALGYNVLAADIYGKGIRPTEPKDAGALAGTYKKDRALFRKRLRSALAVLAQQSKVDSSQLAVVGYCFGGTGAIELARSGSSLRAAISFHGGLDSPQPADGKNIQSKILVLHGADDPHISKNDLQAFMAEMKTHKVDMTFKSYPGAVHSFTDVGAGSDPKKGSAYHAKADEESFKEAQAFLEKAFAKTPAN